VSELKPCPVCEKQPIECTDGEGLDTRYSFACKPPNYEHLCTGLHLSRVGVAKAWNDAVDAYEADEPETPTTLSDVVVAISRRVAELDVKNMGRDTLPEDELCRRVCHAAEDLDVARRCNDRPEIERQAVDVAAHAVRLLLALGEPKEVEESLACPSCGSMAFVSSPGERRPWVECKSCDRRAEGNSLAEAIATWRIFGEPDEAPEVPPAKFLKVDVDVEQPAVSVSMKGSTEPTLKPCPVCGKQPVFERDMFVCRAHLGGQKSASQGGAAEAWNKAAAAVERRHRRRDAVNAAIEGIRDGDDTGDRLMAAWKAREGARMRAAGLVSPYKATFDGQRLVLTAPGCSEWKATATPTTSDADDLETATGHRLDAIAARIDEADFERVNKPDWFETDAELRERVKEAMSYEVSLKTIGYLLAQRNEARRMVLRSTVDLLAKVRDDIAVAVGFKLIDTGSWTNDSVIAAVKRLVQERDDAVADRATVERTRDRLFNERDGATSYLRSNLSEGDRAETLIGCCRAVTERLKQTTKERDYNASEIRRVMVERESLREQCDRDEETIETLNRDNARKAEAVRKANAERDGFREAAAKANEELVAINEACDAPPGTRLVRWAATLKKERDEAIRQAEDHETLRGRVEALEAGFAKLRRDDELKAIR
jgi:hypothetical protein